MKLTWITLANVVCFATSVLATPDAQLPLTVDQVLNEAAFSVDPNFVNEAGFDFSVLGNERLVELEDGSSRWMTELDKIKLKASGRWFMDITETQDLGSLSSLRKIHTWPTKPNATEKVNKVIDTLNAELPMLVLEKLTSYFTRYYLSKTGHQSQQWLYSKIEEVTTSHASESLQDLITITEFKHAWGQNSIIARINGSAPTDDGIIIISGHQDSTNKIPWLRSPGADDDGSGTVTVLEAYRGLIAADFRPIQNVEFHWYAAEEGGLLGSQAVASAYEKAGKNVIAQCQFDMTAWVAKGSQEVIGVYRKFVDDDLTEFNKKLVEEYINIPWEESALPGNAGSDHMAWYKAGYSSSFMSEGTWDNMMHAHIHTDHDAIDVSKEFSFDHIVTFSKFAVAFVIELAGWE